MGGIIERLLTRLSGKAATRSRRKRQTQRRSLRLETMEGRRLLAGDIGVISGTVFTDLTDDGLTGDDALISGATVQIYRDGGNGTFDAGGGDDIDLGTLTTDANGDYSSEDLTPLPGDAHLITAGTYFVQQQAVAGQVQRTSQTVQTVTITETEASGTESTGIDTYDTTVQNVVADFATQTNSASDATAVGEAIGGERDILVNWVDTTGTPATNGNSITADVDGSGLISISTGAGVQGSVEVTYDGVDSDGTVLAQSLGGVDLTAVGGEAFHFLAGSEAGNTLTIEVYSSATDFSTLTENLPVTAGAVASENMIMRFSEFTTGGGSGADFTNVTAIRFLVDMAAATDAQVDFTRIVSPFVADTDFANLNPMAIGNLVFNDGNNNGTRDPGESGISGVEVSLYQDTNSNDSYDAGTDAFVATQTTDGSGNYAFQNLLPGDYIVLIPDTEFAGGEPLFGFDTSTGNDPAPDPDVDSTNDDDNGTLIGGVGVASAVFTLASSTEPTDDGDSDNNTDLSIDFGFTPQIDLAVAKTANNSVVNAGEQLTYTITVSNNGDAAANNVLVTDDLPDLSPDPLTIVSATATGGGTVTQTGDSNREVEVSFASLAPGATETITIVVGVPATAAAATALTNSVTVTGDGNELDNADNSATFDVDITRTAALTINKTDTPDPVAVGSQLTYEIVVSNTGPSTATNVVITDNLPAGLVFDSVNTTAGTASEAAGVVTANVPSLAPSESVTVTIVGTVESTFSGSTLSNSATADADEATLVTANEDTTVNPSVDLEITKTDDADPVDRGGQIVYTMTVTNNGPSDATNVVVVDTLPAGTTFVSATGGTVTPPSGGSSDVTIEVGSLASGASTDVTVTVDVGQAAAGSITNSATVSSTESDAGFDSDTTNNTATESTSTQSVVDLAITKTDSADPVTPGESFTYTLTVNNNGPSDATSVLVTDNIPDGLQITTATSSTGTVNIPSSAQDTTAANNDDLTVDLGTLASGASATITINATVLPGTRGNLSNVATVTSTDATVIESDNANNSVTEDTGLSPAIDLRVEKADSPDPVVAGESLTYSITVTNDGPSTATNVSLSDVLPAGVTFTSVNTSQGSASNTAGTVTADLGTLAPAASATVTIVVGVNPDTRNTITNTATVSATENDTNSTNDSASATSSVNTAIDLAITKSDNADPAVAGGDLTYTIVVTNNGPSTATSVVVADSLPAGVTFVSGNSTVGTVTHSNGDVSANIGTLASGESATITIDTAVAESATGTLSNTATVDGAETETSTANNSATEETEIAVPRSISGNVYLDANENGVRDAGESGVPGVTIRLTGTNARGDDIDLTQTTDASGNYTFSDLLPGTYRLTETQPEGLGDGQANVGTGADGVAGENEISDIVLTGESDAVAFNFGETRSPFSKRRFLASSGPND